MSGVVILAVAFAVLGIALGITAVLLVVWISNR